MTAFITRLACLLMILSLWAQRSADAQSRSPIATVPPLVEFAPDKNIYAKRLFSEPVQIVDHLRDIDPAVLRAFQVQVPPQSISDRDGPFAATDAPLDSSVPSRRLLFAGHTAKFWFILYEHGGIGYHDNLVVLSQQEDGSWVIVAAPQGYVKKGAGFDGLKSALNAGEFYEQAGHRFF